MTTPTTKVPLRLRARKAFVAAGGVAVSALFAALKAGGMPRTQAGWVAVIGGAVGAGVAFGWATFWTRNPGTVNGSDPQPVL